MESLANQKFLEDDLNMRVRDALPIMQARIIDRTTYFGIRTLKNPLDFWVYQELIFAQQPDVVVEKVCRSYLTFAPGAIRAHAVILFAWTSRPAQQGW